MRTYASGKPASAWQARIFPAGRSFGFAAVALGCSLVAAPHAMAQGTTGSIAGTVTDPSGAPVKGAVVTITQVDTAEAHTINTSDKGTYRVPQLLPGKYSVHVEVPGFRSFQQDNIILTIDQVEEIDAKLAVGPNTEMVEVSGGAPVIQTETSSVGVLVDADTIQNTPLNGHVSILGLINLAPGVQDVAAQDQVPVRGVTLAFGTNQRNAYGDAGFTIDGVTNEEIELQRGEGEVPPLDAISQFKLITQGAPAEFGQANQMVIVSASGTNQLHGEVLEFNRSRGTGAKEWFNGTRAAAPVRPPYQRNEFSGNLNGPIILPHLYNGKDRSFFFLSFEGFRLTQSNPVTSTQPTNAERAGDFSSLLGSDGNCIAVANGGKGGTCIYNPLTGQRFPNNIINVPLNPVSTQLQTLLFPHSQTQVIGATTQELIPHSTEVYRSNVRVDHKISDKDSIRGTWLLAFYGPFPDVGTSSLAGGVAQDGEHNDIWVAGWTHTFNPTTILDSQVSYLHLPLYRAAQNYLTDFSFIPGLGSQILNGAPTISITNITGVTEAGSKNLEQTYQGNTALTKVLPRHTIKAGVSYLYNTSWQDSSVSHGGFSFNGQYSADNNATKPAGESTGVAYADFLLGYPNTTSNATPNNYVVRFNSSQYAIYVQDDWKLRPNLTLNFGLRYDLQRFHDNPYGTESLFVPNVGKVVVFANSYPSVSNPLYQQFTTLAPSVNLPTSMFKYVGQDQNNVAPRFGFAYQIHPKTVIRGATGLYYNLLPSAYISAGFSNLPFVDTVSYTNTAGKPTLTMNNPFAASGSVAANPTTIAQHSTVTPYTEQWNLAVEQQLPGSVDLRIGYVGQRTLKQNNYGGPGNTAPDLNYAPPGNTTEQSRRPFQGLSTISYDYAPIYHTTNNSLQIGVHKRYSHGVMVSAEYQWVHVLGLENYQDPTKIGDSYGNTSSITPQTLEVSYAYELPMGHGRALFGTASGFTDKLLSGWQIAGLTSFQTGQPFSVSYSAPGSQTYGASGRADRIMGSPLYPAHKTRQQWFNNNLTANAQTGVAAVAGAQVLAPAFAGPQPYVFGNSAYNMLHGPHYQNWDMNLEKNIVFHERYRIQLRGEAFNVFNHPSFSVPGSAVTNAASFGVISSAVSESRKIEFAGKFNF